jgi:hypothetical protein
MLSEKPFLLRDIHVRVTPPRMKTVVFRREGYSTTRCSMRKGLVGCDILLNQVVHVTLGREDTELCHQLLGTLLGRFLASRQITFLQKRIAIVGIGSVHLGIRYLTVQRIRQKVH